MAKAGRAACLEVDADGVKDHTSECPYLPRKISVDASLAREKCKGHGRNQRACAMDSYAAPT